MNEGRTANFVSGQSKAERQVWNVSDLGGEGVEGAIEMTAQYATGKAAEAAQGAAEQYRTQAERAAMVGQAQAEGLLAGTKEYDITNDGVESEVEIREVADAAEEEGLKLDNVVIFPGGRKENPSKVFVMKMEQNFGGGRMKKPYDVQKSINEARPAALRSMFGRIYPNNGEAA